MPQDDSSRRLADFELLREIGRGGMGVVYEAHQVSLDRTVAVKFLTEQALGNEELRARFLREARMAAALNHPGICTIHEVREVQPGEEIRIPGGPDLPAGTPYISMEWIDGRSLSSLIGTPELRDLDKQLAIAVQVAEALAAAHARGIVHRDLKPGNVMVTGDGRAKIVDFGLAKPVLSHGGSPEDATETLSDELTRQGRILGTVAYMSPEQAMGKPLDPRSDVFSFGTLLYEMVTGRRPFRGENPASTLAKIIESEPEPAEAINPELPQDLARIVRRCLRKNPGERYNDTRDLVVALKELRQVTTSGAPEKVRGEARVPPPRSMLRRRSLWGSAAALVLLVAIAGVFLVWTRGGRNASTAPPTYRQITYTGTVRAPAVSPDGQFIAYVETAASGDDHQLTVQDLAGGRPLVILSSPGIGIPRWTPDGTEVVVNFSRADDVRNAYLVPRLGGTPRRVPTFDYIAWSPDGTRFAGAEMHGREITITEKSTGDQRTIPLEMPVPWFLGLDWSPTGGLFAIVTYSDEKNLSTIWTLPAAGGAPHRIFEKDVLYSPRFSPRGDAIYYLSGRSGSATSSLWKAAIDPESGRPSGEPTLVLSTLEIPTFPPHAAFFAISRDGKRLSYARNTTRSNLWLAEVNARSEGGVKTTQLTSGTALDVSPRFSPDGRSVVFVRGNHVFVLRLDGSPPEPLTFGEADHFAPAWSPDGREIAFVSQERGTSVVSRISASGGDARPFKRTVGSGDRAGDLAWSPGKRILYQKAGNRNFALLDPETEDESPLLGDESLGFLWRPRYSPDVTRVAVFRNWTNGPVEGASVISVDNSAETRLRDGFAWPLGWSPDGAFVYVIASAKIGPTLTLTNPEILKISGRGGPAVDVVKLPFKEVNVADGGNDVSSDGRHFVFAVPDTRSDAWLIENFDPDVR